MRDAAGRLLCDDYDERARRRARIPMTDVTAGELGQPLLDGQPAVVGGSSPAGALDVGRRDGKRGDGQRLRVAWDRHAAGVDRSGYRLRGDRRRTMSNSDIRMPILFDVGLLRDYL